jgi:hypothetical protein
MRGTAVTHSQFVFSILPKAPKERGSVTVRCLLALCSLFF